MKKILLLTYYYPPYTGIEGNRAHSWAHFLAANNFQVTVITRHWKAGAQHEWKDYFSEYQVATEKESIQENLTVIRVPYQWSKGFKTSRGLPFSSIHTWFNKLLGHFHIETNARHSLYETSCKEMKQQRFDFMIVTSPPLNIIRLGIELKKKFRVPLVVDFRDSFNNHLLNPAFSPTWKDQLEIFLFKAKLKHWLRQADIVSSVSDAVLNTLPLRSAQPTVVVMNGYENNTFNRETTEPSSRFTIASVGSLYETMDLDFMARGIALFLNKVQPDDMEVVFVGLRSRMEVRKTIEKHIDPAYLNFTNRVSRQEALNYMHQAAVLLQVGWRGYKGFCPGKVFEYLAAQRNILIAPGDGDLTDKVVAETGAGFSANTIEEMAAYLEEKYREWKTTGHIDYKGKSEVIEKYSRDRQNEKLVQALNDLP